jgi:hypothetical protein
MMIVVTLLWQLLLLLRQDASCWVLQERDD